MSSAVAGFDLSQIAVTTSKQLTDVWDQLGESPGERDRLTQQLCTDVVSLYNNVLAAQRARVADAQARVDMFLNNIRSIAHDLAESPPAGIIDLAHVSLLQRVEKLKNCLESLQLKRSKRYEQLYQSHQALQELWEALEFSAADRDPCLALFDESQLSEARLAAYEAALVTARNESRSRESVIAKHSARIAELFETLCEPLNASSALDAAVLDRSVVASLGCGRRVIEQLAARLASLDAKREEREERVKAFAVDITVLWDRLGVSEEERDDFYELHQGLGPSVLAACANELTRLRALKQARMHELVGSSRQRIAALWQKLGFSEQQRGAFFRTCYLADRLDDELLDAHEAEERALEERLAELTPILVAIEEREGLMDEKRQMDLLASDPERLTSRRRDPGRLLREEKFRTRFAKLLPVCEQRLESLIGAWEIAHPDEAPFLYQGVAYRAALDTVNTARRANNTAHYAVSTAASTAAITQATPTMTRARAHTTPAVAVAPATLSRAQTMALNTPRTPLSSMPTQQMNTRSRAAAGDVGESAVVGGIGAKGRAATTGLRMPSTATKTRR